MLSMLAQMHAASARIEAAARNPRNDPRGRSALKVGRRKAKALGAMSRGVAMLPVRMHCWLKGIDSYVTLTAPNIAQRPWKQGARINGEDR